VALEDATALAGAIRAGETSAVAVMEAALEAASSLDRIGAVARLEPALGRAGAMAADRNAAGAVFHGVPFLAKDLGAHAAGLAPAAGSMALRHLLPQPEVDSTLFARFRAAGLIPFGLSTVSEFGLALTSEPPGGPVARNPWDETLSPGGSSGGAAAAVAAGIVAIAHATDAAGSIRVPAACCGLTGLKPGRDAVPAGPDFGNYLMGLGSELVLARSVRDVAAAFEAVAPPGPALTPDRPIIALAIGPGTGPAGIAALRTAADGLASAGCEVREIDPAALDALGARAGPVASLVLPVSLAEWLDSLGVGAGDVSPLAAAVAAQGRATPAQALFAAAREMARIGHDFDVLLGDADAILTPVLAGSAPRIGQFDTGCTDPQAHFAALGALAPNAALANVAGVPALVLPVVMPGAALPTGVQLAGKAGADRMLLRLGARLEAELPRPRFPYRIAGFPQ
jgi:amidase